MKLGILMETGNVFFGTANACRGHKLETFKAHVQNGR
jgi:hypothetical protein